MTTVSIRRQTVITGGDLKANYPWVPSLVTTVDGVDFVALSRDDRRLAAFCGVDCKAAHPLRDCTWLTALAQMRRDAVSAARSRASRDEDVLADQVEKATEKKATGKELPPVLTLQMPPIDAQGMSHPGGPLKVLSDHGDAKRLVSIELSEESLEYVRCAVKVDALTCAGPVRTRRTKAERIQCEGDVRWNYQRNAPYATVTDEDGRKRSVHVKPTPECPLPTAVVMVQARAAELQRRA